jgi:hypothetical protein
MPVEMQFATEFMSHKFKGNGLKYEVGVCIATGHIVWVHGPSRAGKSNITLARQAFVSFLNDDEMAVANSGYQGEFQLIKTPDKVHFRSGLEFYDAAVARACYETVNLRFKNNQVLVKRLRHSLAFHSACFQAVAVVSQLIIKNVEPLFDVQYSDEGRKV